MSTPASASPPGQAAPEPNRTPPVAADGHGWRAVSIVLVGAFMALLDTTIVTVALLADGTISDLSIARSSGYADIDQRIEAMVAAVQKFPPVPQWFQGHSLELQLTLRFPEALERD